jgi:hypothetical protein
MLLGSRPRAALTVAGALIWFEARSLAGGAAELVDDAESLHRVTLLLTDHINNSETSALDG